MDRVIAFDRKEHALALLCRLDEMRNDEVQTDFKIKVGHGTILAQRDILIAASDYFKAMLSYDMKENQRGEVEMMDADFECVKICIDFIYGREVAISPEKYEDLMFIAHMLQLTKLCSSIEQLMVEEIDSKSFFTMKKIADLYNCQILGERCEEYAEKNLKLIAKENAFYEISKDYLMSLMKPVRKNASEKQKLDILLDWVRHDTNRNSLLPSMMCELDLDKIPIGHRRFLSQNEPIISENLESFRMLSLSVMNAVELSLECPERILIFDSSCENVKTFNPNNSKIKNTTIPKCTIQDSYELALMKDYIYALGKDKSVYRLKYSDNNSSWEQVAEMLYDHGRRPPVAVFSDHMYVIGGFGLLGCTSAAESFNQSKNEWTKLTDKPKKSNGAALFATAGYVYCFGGFADRDYTAEVIKLDVDKSVWNYLAPMNNRRVGATVAELEGSIIVAGGENKDGHLKTVEKYDIECNQWTMLESMNIARSIFRIYTVDNSLYAIGGRKSQNAKSSIEKYDTTSGAWLVVELQDSSSLDIRYSVMVNKI